jgi:tetratricopeptide (TPR) repeat protein
MPKAHTFRDRSASLFGREPDIQFLLSRARMKGLTAVAGRPKMGKTWLLEEVARRLTEEGFLVGYHESTGQTSDILLRCLSDLYTRWLSDSSYVDQARVLWKQHKDSVVTSFGKALGSILQSVAKPAEPIAKLLDGLAVADADLKSGGVRLTPLQYDQVHDLVATLSLLSDGRPIALVLDAWEQSPGLSSEHAALLRFLQRTEDWPSCHIFAGVREPHHGPTGGESPAYGLCTELAAAHPAAVVFDLPPMHLEDATARESLIRAIRQSVAPARSLADEAIVSLVGGFPGVVERLLRREGGPRLGTVADMVREAADAQSYRYREFDRLLAALSPEERSVCLRVALLPRMRQAQWELLRPVLLGSLAPTLVHELNLCSVFVGASFASYGHETRHAAARRWFLEKPQYASLVLEEACYLAVELAARHQAIDEIHRPFAEALLGLMDLSHLSEAPLVLRCLPVLVQFFFWRMEPSLQVTPVADALAIARQDKRLAPMVSMALLSQGAIRALGGDHAGAAEDFTAVIDMPDAPPQQRAQALLGRGLTRGETGDTKGELADYSAVIKMPDAPSQQRAPALINRGASRGQQGDRAGAAEDFTAVIDMPDAPSEPRARALLGRGTARAEQGDYAGAAEDFAAVIGMREVPSEQRSRALLGRGAAIAEQGDYAGAADDFAAVIGMREVPSKQRARALVSRGGAEAAQGDYAGAAEDFTVVIGMRDVPSEERARALLGRGAAKAAQGDYAAAAEDSIAVIGMPDAPSEQRAMALHVRGHARESIGDAGGALADYSAVIEMPDAPAAVRADAVAKRKRITDGGKPA